MTVQIALRLDDRLADAARAAAAPDGPIGHLGELGLDLRPQPGDRAERGIRQWATGRPKITAVKRSGWAIGLR